MSIIFIIIAVILIIVLALALAGMFQKTSLCDKEQAEYIEYLSKKKKLNNDYYENSGF